MEFRIADTFTDSLARLTGDEQKAVKTTAFDLQMNPFSPGMNFHKLDKAKDKNFWSVRVNSDIRLIVHKTAASLLLCYVDHHDQAYHWAERRKLETHPATGAAQLVEIRERVEEIAVPKYVVTELPVASETLTPKPLLFSRISEQDLLQYGVPVEWLPDVMAANEDTVLDLADHLPAEAAEALLELATGGKPQRMVAAPPANPFEHPDALRRFRTLANVEELEQALAYPWEKWTIFLHPSQQEWVVRDYSGPSRVSGSAGTGKTIVALHRAVHLARINPDARVLLATFSEPLARALHTKLARLISTEPRLGERIEVRALDAVATRLYEIHVGKPSMASREDVRALLDAAARTRGLDKFSNAFLLAEWEDVVDAWQLDTWEGYRDVRRLGRKTRLAEGQRAELWAIFEAVRDELQRRSLVTRAGMFHRLTQEIAKRTHPPFEFAVIDEAQDISVAQLRFLAAVGQDRPNALFFAGDIGQRIFQQPFSWKSLGVDIRGRARTLHINYRTSHQIRVQADRLLAPELADVDGNTETRVGTISVFNGPVPEIVPFDDVASERDGVAGWLRARAAEGMLPHEVGVFVRSQAELDRACAAIDGAGLKWKVLDEAAQTAPEHVSVCTMHLAKGMEFRATAVMACDDEVLPLQERVEAAGDYADLEEIYNTERHLLYVACTRARDYLWVSGVEPVSEFLDDLVSNRNEPRTC